MPQLVRAKQRTCESRPPDPVQDRRWKGFGRRHACLENTGWARGVRPPSRISGGGGLGAEAAEATRRDARSPRAGRTALSFIPRGRVSVTCPQCAWRRAGEDQKRWIWGEVLSHSVLKKYKALIRMPRSSPVLWPEMANPSFEKSSPRASCSPSGVLFSPLSYHNVPFGCLFPASVREFLWGGECGGVSFVCVILRNTCSSN